MFGIPADLIEDLEEVVPKSSNSYGGSTSLQDQRLLSGMARLLDGESKQMSAGTMLRLITMVESVFMLRSTGMNRKVTAWISLTTFWTLDHLMLGFGRHIYGLKTAFLKTKAFKQGNWISLGEYIERESAKLPDIEVIQNERNRENPYQELFRKLGNRFDNEIVKEYNDTVELAKAEHSNKFAYNVLGLGHKIKSEDKLQQIAHKFVAEYPVVELLHWNGSHASD